MQILLLVVAEAFWKYNTPQYSPMKEAKYIKAIKPFPLPECGVVRYRGLCKVIWSIELGLNVCIFKPSNITQDGFFVRVDRTANSPLLPQNFGLVGFLHQAPEAF
jgi:hypothetical protein